MIFVLFCLLELPKETDLPMPAERCTCSPMCATIVFFVAFFCWPMYISCSHSLHQVYWSFQSSIYTLVMLMCLILPAYMQKLANCIFKRIVQAEFQFPSWKDHMLFWPLDISHKSDIDVERINQCNFSSATQCNLMDIPVECPHCTLFFKWDNQSIFFLSGLSFSTAWL